MYFMYLDLRIKLNKWGNSLGIRIPKAYIDELDLKENSEMIMKVKKDKIILEKPDDDFEDLISKITDENKHQSVDWGNAVGKEVW